jgi:putative acetyltransferase
MNAAPEIRVRSAGNADRERVKALVGAVLTEYGLALEPEGTDADLENLEENYLNRGGVFELLEGAGGELLGTVGLYPMPSVGEGTPKTVELRKMYFVPQLRGQGWGKKTLTRMIETARERGFKRVILETHSVLKEAIGLYKSFGFLPSCESKHSARCDQMFFLEL